MESKTKFLSIFVGVVLLLSMLSAGGIIIVDSPVNDLGIQADGSLSGVYDEYSIGDDSLKGSEDTELHHHESAGNVSEPGETGDYNFEVWTTDFTDPYDETVPVDIYYPSDTNESPYPSLVIGHGFTMDKSYFETWGEYYASWGYVTAVPSLQYAGMFDSDHEKCAYELLATVDLLKEKDNETGSEIEGMVDEEKMALTGFSLGAKASILAAEYEVQDGRDDVKAIAPMAPALDKDPDPLPDLDLIDIPVQLQAGENDGVAPPEENSKLVYDGLEDSPTQYFMISGANHNQYADRDPVSGGWGDGDPDISREEQHRIARKYTTSFFNYYLKEQDGYREYLYGDPAEDDVDNGTLVFNDYKYIKAKEHDLKINIDGEGTTDPSAGSHIYEEGTNVTVEATPNQGWEFVEWTGDEAGTDTTLNVTMDSDKNITAVFEEEAGEYELTISIDGEGTTAPSSGTHTFEEGTNVTVEATSADGWQFVEWTGDETCADMTINITMNSDKNITAIFEKESSGEYELTISINGEGATQPSAGNHTYEEMTNVTVEAIPAEGWEFTNWTGDETGTDTTINVTMDSNKDITAVFEETEEYDLIINVEGAGTTEPSEGTHSYEDGEEVTVTATPEEGWQFVEWTGDHTAEDEEITVTMDEGKEITAHFEELVAYDLTINAEEGGTTDPEPGIYTREEGTEVTVEAIPEDDWKFVEWTGDEIGTDPKVDIEMDSDKEITAVFEEDIETFELTTNIEGEGSIEVDPDQNGYEEGTEVEMEAIPDEDWYFEEWTGDHEGTEEKITITMDEDKGITAHFEEYEPAHFEVEIIDYDKNVKEGEEITVEYKVTNTGELEGTQDIALYLNGEEVALENDITLAPGEEYEDEFTVEAEKVGEQTLEIGSNDEMSEEEEMMIEEKDTDNGGGFLSNYLWIIPIIAIGSFLAVLAFVMKGKKEEKSSYEQNPPQDDQSQRPPPS